MKSERLFESQGDPIILSQELCIFMQIKNEYGPSSKAIGALGYLYMTWAAKMVVELDTGVPWVMCKEDDSPDPVVSDHIICLQRLGVQLNSGQFKIWPMQLLTSNKRVDRSLILHGLFKTCTYHGGTNYGRTAGGPFITTTCEYDAPLDEYGLTRQPKYGHLTEIHRAIKLCDKALLSTDPVVTSLGSYQQVLDISFSKYNASRSINAHVFSSKNGGSVAFLVNHNPESAAKVVYNNKHYNLPPWSICILPDCEKVAIQLTFFLMLSSFRP
ncbi:hypothetical protein GIB67_042122 [Kingdonia uniflora]|uniref:beta-galactosidase n=1 Tax=Kingdonia uniflora TaxID=39325 RepID=A0A7J7NNQ0_9MAGN|nr:hypothetical protein GIB67_042122 [Kingdonia uniflora]